MSSTEKFAQLKLRFIDPIQYDYEVIRPVVLFAETLTERSRQTEVERTRVGEKARRFVQQGMFGLIDQRIEKSGGQYHQYPEPVATRILSLKQLYPPIGYREIVRIIKRQFGYKTNHHTVKNFLKRHPIPVQLELAITHFHQFEDAYQARWTVVQMYYQGWHKKSIAGCLKLSARHVRRIIDTFDREGFAGLEDKRTRPANHSANQMSLPFLKEVLDVQKEYPRAGKFRVRGLLEKQYREQGREPNLPSERTVSRAMALNRQFHGAPGPWRSRKDDLAEETPLKHLPYRPGYRHHIWYVDIRYLVKLDGQWVYSICILEGYSRTMLAGMAVEHQDLTAILQTFYAALAEYGCPDLIVSDNAKVFKAFDYQHILRELAIKPKYIEKGKPWQNLIEAQFKIQPRLADYKFENAQTLQQVQNQHAEFIETFNSTAHHAHRKRKDGRRTPTDLLSWAKGAFVAPERLHLLFQRVTFTRTVNRFGFVSVQRFYIYAEHGLSRQRVSIWIYEGQLYIQYQQVLLAQYQTDFNQSLKRLQALSQPTLYQTDFASPQLVLFELDDDQWLKVRRRSYDRHQKSLSFPAIQPPLIELDEAI